MYLIDVDAAAVHVLRLGHVVHQPTDELGLPPPHLLPFTLLLGPSGTASRGSSGSMWQRLDKHNNRADS